MRGKETRSHKTKLSKDLHMTKQLQHLQCKRDIIFITVGHRTTVCFCYGHLQSNRSTHPKGVKYY